jgi:hypothetical protein
MCVRGCVRALTVLCCAVLVQTPFFSEPDLRAMFAIFDPTGRGFITDAQLQTGEGRRCCCCVSPRTFLQQPCVCTCVRVQRWQTLVFRASRAARTRTMCTHFSVSQPAHLRRIADRLCVCVGAHSHRTRVSAAADAGDDSTRGPLNFASLGEAAATGIASL